MRRQALEIKVARLEKELNEAVARNRELEAKLKEKIEIKFNAIDPELFKKYLNDHPEALKETLKGKRIPK
jgi:hypothetical protein